MATTLRVILLCGVFLLCGCSALGFESGDYRNLEEAEEYLRQGQHDKAIEAYRAHMRYRLSLSDRPDWENPYLYLLMIGDVQLRQGKPLEAQTTYELAEKNKVDKALVSDRYRYLASWYEKQGELESALKILSMYRDRDELLFDVMRDRMAKDLVKREELQTSSAPPSATTEGGASH